MFAVGGWPWSYLWMHPVVECYIAGTCMLLLSDMKASGIHPTSKVCSITIMIHFKWFICDVTFNLACIIWLQVYSLIINACSFGGRLSLAEEVWWRFFCLLISWLGFPSHASWTKVKDSTLSVLFQLTRHLMEKHSIVYSSMVAAYARACPVYRYNIAAYSHIITRKSMLILVHSLPN